MNRNTLSVSGINSLRFVEEINIDTAIMATSGYSSEYGFTNGEYNEGELKKAVIRKARKVVMIMDLSKVDMTPDMPSSAKFTAIFPAS